MATYNHGAGAVGGEESRVACVTPWVSAAKGAFFMAFLSIKCESNHKIPGNNLQAGSKVY
jgi:hypothetical protein